jgi:hypothetical protein
MYVEFNVEEIDISSPIELVLFLGWNLSRIMGHLVLTYGLSREILLDTIHQDEPTCAILCLCMFVS